MTYKYINDHGVHKLNPEWSRTHTNTAMETSYPFQNRATALPVVSYPSQQNLFSPDDEEIVVAPSYQVAENQYHDILVEAEIIVEAEAVSEGGHHLGQLAGVLAKYEVPAGMLSKLLGLRDFTAAEFLVDDSGSMSLNTDAKGPNGESLTRWIEAKLRILQMIELMSYVPHPKVEIHFLNRSNVLQLEQKPGELPTIFYERCKAVVDAEFSIFPAGSTPALECIRNSLNRYRGERVLRYFFGDGVPNGGQSAIREIARLLKTRAEPENNPFTFLSCTNQDEDTEWMKECEEVALYCSEFDDYVDESREIIKDQGKAFPYSYGLHLVGQLVAAFNPHDLDALDESVPLTKQTLEDLLGYRPSEQEYKYYFDSFLAAQRLLPLLSYQRGFVAKLPGLYETFASTPVAADIPEVAEYRRQMKSPQQLHGSRGVSAAPPQDGCCVVL